MKFAKKINRVIAIIFLSIFICGCTADMIELSNSMFMAETCQESKLSYESSPENVISPENKETQAVSKSTLTAHYLDVGQGDSILITCDNEAMLIDAGDNTKGTYVQNYLNKQNVTSLKYVVVTHSDSDHCGGIDVIITKFDCKNVIIKKEDKDTKTYSDVWSAISYTGTAVISPEVGNKYTLGSAILTIIGPKMNYENSNNNSIAILLEHGENRFLFTGDAEFEEEQAIVNNEINISDIDVYKCGHHGSKTSSSDILLDAITPKAAVISCGEGNEYGHPHAATLNNLRSRGVAVYRTDDQGTIIAVSDGHAITFNISPSDFWQAG